MKDLTHICSSCPDYPSCNFDCERVYVEHLKSNKSSHANERLHNNLDCV